jgi:hypothetical protein
MTQDMSGLRRPEQSRSDQIKDTAGQIKDEAQQRVGAVAAQAQDQLKSRIATQKDSAAESLSGVAEALRQTGNQLRASDQTGAIGLLDEAASQVERLSGYLQHNDLNRLVRDAESFARRQPALFLGGAFLIGLVGARFLKSSRPAEYDDFGYDPSTGYTRPYAGQYSGDMGDYRSANRTGEYGAGYRTGGEFGTTTGTGYGGATSGVYQAPDARTERPSADETTRSRAYGERLEE